MTREETIKFLQESLKLKIGVKDVSGMNRPVKEVVVQLYVCGKLVTEGATIFKV